MQKREDFLTVEEEIKLKEKVKEIKLTCLEMCVNAGLGHALTY